MRKAISLALVVLLCPLSLFGEAAKFTLSAEAEEKLLADLALSYTPVSLRPLRYTPSKWRLQTPPPVFHASQNTEGIVIASIGGGLAALGIVLAATSGESGTVVVSTSFGSAVVDVRTVNNGKRWGGVGLAIGGGFIIWHGLAKMNK